MNRRIDRRPTRVPSGLGFTPRSISGLVAWYRADLGITIGTGVSAWANQVVGDANTNFTQAVAGRQPTYSTSDAALGGAASLQGGATKSMQSGLWASALAQPMTILWSGIASTAVEQLLIQGISTNVFIESTVTDKRPYIYAGSSLISASGDLTAKHVGGGEYNGASSKIYLNSTTAVATGAGGASSLLDMTIMNVIDGGALPWLGSLHELVFINRVLTAGELLQLMTYMGARIGQAIS